MQFTYQITKAKKQTHTHNIQKLSLFHGNNDYTNVPHCYIMCIMSVLLDKWYVITNFDWFRTCPNESFVQVSPPLPCSSFSVLSL